MVADSTTQQQQHDLPFELRAQSGSESLRKLLGGFCGERGHLWPNVKKPSGSKTKVKGKSEGTPAEASIPVVQDVTTVMAARSLPHHVCTESNTASSSTTSSGDEIATPTKSQPPEEVTKLEKSVSFSAEASETEQVPGQLVLDESIIHKEGEKSQWSRIMEITVVTILAVLGTYLAVQRMGGDINLQLSSHRELQEGMGLHFRQAAETEQVGAVRMSLDIKRKVEEAVTDTTEEEEYWYVGITSKVDENASKEVVFEADGSFDSNNITTEHNTVIGEEDGDIQKGPDTKQEEL